MAGELQTSFSAAKTIYYLVRNAVGQIWNTATSAFVKTDVEVCVDNCYQNLMNVGFGWLANPHKDTAR